MPVKGECLCGGVQFEVLGELGDLYQCHCSLCRKATGAQANAAALVPSASLRWLCGQEKISSFRRRTGFRHDFCSSCGSSVPNPLRDTGLFWVPAGLLPGELDVEVVVHLHLASRATWEREAEACSRHAQGFDDLAELLEVLWRKKAST